MNRKLADSHEAEKSATEFIKSSKKKGFGYYFGRSLLVLLFLSVVTLIVFGINSPESEVVPGKQMNQQYLDFLNEQGLVDSNELIHFWYSDGFGDFKKGFYFFTSQKVVLYSKTWSEPALIIPYSKISDIEFEHNASRWEDSYITLYLKDESVVFIPVSSTNKGDFK